MFKNNNKSAFDSSDFVTEAVLELLKNDCIEEVKIKPAVVNPLKKETYFRSERS